MARSSPRNPKNFRQCVTCRQLFDKATMHRIVYSKQPPQLFVFKANDTKTRAEGRSAYCCTSETCFNKAIKGKKLAKTLKTSLSDDIVHVLGS